MTGRAFCSVIVLLGCRLAFSQVATPATTSIPFMGCKSDGQLGPQDAPTGKSIEAVIPAAAAQRLAYYKAESGMGVLGPRGWYCFGTYGSNGDELYVSPTRINSDELLSTKRKGFTGPAIEISCEYGGTSGRFAVATVIARVFPDRLGFVKRVVTDERKVGLPGTRFAYGPYKNDVLTYRSGNVVEFKTPPNTEGPGTHSWLLKNGYPIRGVAILVGTEPDLIQLSVRLSSGTSDLASFIIERTEWEADQAGRGLE